MIIENFTLKEFLKQEVSLIQEYVVALQYAPQVQTKKEVFHLKLKHVEYIKKNIFASNDEGLVKIIKIVQGIKKAEVYNLTIIEFFGLIASVKEQIEKISHAEAARLTSSEINFKWLAVDGDAKMSKFGIYNTLEALSNGDATKYKYFHNLEYSEVFTILFMRKTASELSKQMETIKVKS